MRRICYISKSLIGYDEGKLASIMAASVRHNESCHITSLLLFDGNRFMQSIEGESNVVEKCFDKICMDSRHCDINMFESADISAREFGGWSLNIRNALDMTVDQFKRHVADDVRSVTELKTKAMFIGFAALGHR